MTQAARITDLPIVRSSFCADDVRGGTRLLLVEDNGRFLIATRFQTVGRRKRIEDAIALFERTLIGA